MPLPDTFVLLDLETTGANPVADRITEIAAIRVEGGQVVERWETLVNPDCAIPPFIERIIGITDAMVADAPRFAELAPRVRAFLDGAVFVAHNVRFDYGFIRNEFSRIGEDFEAPVMCTVKLSRALYPEHHRHGLDALIARHGFMCDARHRAMGDADVLWQFLQLAQREFPAEVFEKAWERASRFAARPPTLPEGILEGLPDASGVYRFYGEADEVLFVGRSVSLRARVMEHFAAIDRKSKEGDLARAVRRLDWIEAAGELAATLLEMELVRTHRPRHNRLGAIRDEACGLRVSLRRRRPPVLARVPLEGSDPADWEDVFGAFRGRKEADAVLREIASTYQLCLRRLGFEAAGSGACAACRAGRCAGVCANRETSEEHDERLMGALRGLSVKPWPWAGPVVITERSEHTEAVAHQVFDRWCHLGSADSAEGLAALLGDSPPRAFDIDIWRVLQRWLASPGNADKVEPR